MTHKTFYVCDGCGSYFDPKAGHVLMIRVIKGPDYNSSMEAATTPAGGANPDYVRREICRGCATELLEKFKLGVSASTLESQTFPSAVPKVGLED